MWQFVFYLPVMIWWCHPPSLKKMSAPIRPCFSAQADVGSHPPFLLVTWLSLSQMEGDAFPHRPPTRDDGHGFNTTVAVSVCE